MQSVVQEVSQQAAESVYNAYRQTGASILVKGYYFSTLTLLKVNFCELNSR